MNNIFDYTELDVFSAAQFRMPAFRAWVYNEDDGMWRQTSVAIPSHSISYMMKMYLSRYGDDGKFFEVEYDGTEGTKIVLKNGETFFVPIELMNVVMLFKSTEAMNIRDLQKN